MEYAAIGLAATALVFSLVILWTSISSMLDGKSIGKFLSFFFLGIVLSYYGAVILFELFFDWAWVVVESAILLCLVWVFVDIWREHL